MSANAGLAVVRNLTRAWLVLFVALNVLSVVVWSMFDEPTSRGMTSLAGFIAAAGLQLPVVLVFVVPHVLTALWWSGLPRPVAWGVGSLLTALPVFLLVFFYAGSQYALVEQGSFLALDLMAAAFTDTAQLAGDVVEGNEALLIAAFVVATAATIGILRTGLPGAGSPSRACGWRSALPQILVLVHGGGAILLFGLPDAVNESLRRASIDESLPTAYVVWSRPLFDERRENDRIGAFEPFSVSELEPELPIEKWAARNPMTARKRNVFILLLESIPSDNVGFSGYHRSEITPHLDALSEASLVFPNTYAPSNHSNYAQTSFHASQYPRRGVRMNNFRTVDYPKVLLFDILGAYGYQTAFISAQNEDWQGMRRFLMANTTFQHFYDSNDAPAEALIGFRQKIDDSAVVKEAIRFLDHEREPSAAGRPHKPLYMYLNLQRTHFPYELREEVDRPYEPYDLTTFRFKFFLYDKKHIPTVHNAYDNALHYVDAQVGVFIRGLKERGLYDDALIVVSADHAEAFYKKGYPSHGTSFFDDQIKTFTLVKLPESRLTGRREYGISLLDINPTVLNQLGLPNHPNFQGVPVIEANERPGPIFMTAQGMIKAEAVVEHPWKFMRSERDGERLMNTRIDPAEETDLSDRFPEVRVRLERALNTYAHKQIGYYQKLPVEQRLRFYPPQYPASLLGHASSSAAGSKPLP